MIRIFRALGIIRTPQEKAFSKVRHLDANNAERRMVMKANRETVKSILSKGQ